MLKFLKILARNLLQGPPTDPFPFKEAPTPQRFRGRVTMDPQKCVGCAICRHVCAGRAIHIQPHEEGTGYDFAIWHNSCALCGMCRHFCPTGAITMTNDWHNAHTQEEKYSWTEHHFVPYLRCAGCDAPMRLLPPDLATRIYAHSPVDMTELMKLCPSCRQVAEAQRLENIAHELVELIEEAAVEKDAPAPLSAETSTAPEAPASKAIPAAPGAETPVQTAPTATEAAPPAKAEPDATQAEAPAQARSVAAKVEVSVKASPDTAVPGTTEPVMAEQTSVPLLESEQTASGSVATVAAAPDAAASATPVESVEISPAGGGASPEKKSEPAPAAKKTAAAGTGKTKKPAKAKPAQTKPSATKKSAGKKAKATPADS